MSHVHYPTVTTPYLTASISHVSARNIPVELYPHPHKGRFPHSCFKSKNNKAESESQTFQNCIACFSRYLETNSSPDFERGGFKNPKTQST